MNFTARPLLGGLALALLLLWLLINESLAGGQLILGAAVVLFVLLATNTMRPVRARLRRPGVALRLFGRVLFDMLRSSLHVVGVILGGAERRRHAGFMEIPLDLRDPHGLAVLAMIVTSTPGTVWSDLSADGCVLTLHVLELKDHQHWIDTIKQRYERPLMEIFE